MKNLENIIKCNQKFAIINTDDGCFFPSVVYASNNKISKMGYLKNSKVE